MTVARAILILIIAAGPLTITACAPPKPKVAVLFVPQVGETGGALPHYSLDWLRR